MRRSPPNPSPPVRRQVRAGRVVTGALALLALTGLMPSWPPRRPTWCRRRSAQEQAGSPTTLTLAGRAAVVGRGRAVVAGRPADRPGHRCRCRGRAGPGSRRCAPKATGSVAAATTDGAGAVAVAQTLDSSATYRLHHGTTGSRRGVGERGR